MTGGYVFTGVCLLRSKWGVPPSQVQAGVGVPLPRPRWGVPSSQVQVGGQGDGCSPFPSPGGGHGVPLPPPPSRSHPRTGEALLSGGLYASCVHAGGLSCLGYIVLFYVMFSYFRVCFHTSGYVFILQGMFLYFRVRFHILGYVFILNGTFSYFRVCWVRTSRCSSV